MNKYTLIIAMSILLGLGSIYAEQPTRAEFARQARIEVKANVGKEVRDKVIRLTPEERRTLTGRQQIELVEARLAKEMELTAQYIVDNHIDTLIANKISKMQEEIDKRDAYIKAQRDYIIKIEAMNKAMRESLAKRK
jgi:hypothetical protein